MQRRWGSIIITDHHEPDTELPDALAVGNPKRRDCSYPEKNLAGVGVALQAGASALRPFRPQPLDSRIRESGGDRNAGGRHALTGENRVI